MPSIIYFGSDRCHRLPVLKQAGFSVVECDSLWLLNSILIQFPDPDAIAIEENDEIDVDLVLSLVRSYCTAPIVLFENAKAFPGPSEFALVVPLLTDPHQWVRDLASLSSSAAHRTTRQQSI